MTAAQIRKLNRLIENIEVLQRGLEINGRVNGLLRSAKTDLITARNLERPAPKGPGWQGEAA
jgi:hypothetical protein